jgi:hypothetical protein
VKGLIINVHVSQHERLHIAPLISKEDTIDPEVQISLLNAPGLVKVKIYHLPSSSSFYDHVIEQGGSACDGGLYQERKFATVNQQY